MQATISCRTPSMARMGRPSAARSSRLAPGAIVPRTVPSTPFMGATMRQQQHRQRELVCQGLFGLGLPEVVVIAGVAALIFGPSKLPELGKGLGKTVKSFQNAAKEFEQELKAATADDEEDPAKKKPEQQ